MIERIAIPAWGTEPTSTEVWRECLETTFGPTTVELEDRTVSWFECPSKRVRGYALIENSSVSAINFELYDEAPDESLALLEAAAGRLGWELHVDDDDDADDNDTD